MRKYEENISDSSLWVTTTPTPLAETLPFYITEAGYFSAEHNYEISRSFHDSHLLLYTVSGTGIVMSDNEEISLPPKNCVIIDCRRPHRYFSASAKWEFIWLHFKGSAVSAMTAILYPSETRAVETDQPQNFKYWLESLLDKVKENDVLSSITLSTDVHHLFDVLIRSTMKNERANQKKEHITEIDNVIEYIRENYMENITVDDMVNRIHLSKYHFIRIFKRIMGITPYSYLTNYRINISKQKLRLTNKSVADIAADCGFMDTSNFIAQFKKHTGVKPVQYRRDFK
ncbi:MAG: AraC family transcriptional regulator [Oscillospiraceae bacterium]|nr:AraC family transcriptional regulator [Oscillospiraceae bacterium]